ncbi:MAG: hypothetical protein F4Y14_21855 [Acidobacteria bacterium]|nr:hypothetical protein [Acidobacteriota bacterium]
MRKTTSIGAAAAILLGVVAVASVSGERGGAYRESRDHPAFLYTNGAVDNAVEDLNRRLEEGSAALAFEGRSGYLRSLLDALDMPVESQVLVFSPTSFQEDWIDFDNPRAVFFRDDVALGWVRGADVIEISAQDRRQGTIFYSLEQTPSAAPRFRRRETCLACHLSWDTLGVPGPQVLSMFPMPDDPNAYASGHPTDHRSRLEDRWGGWYVTGSHGGVAHMGNVEVEAVEDPHATFGVVPPVIDSLDGRFDLEGFPTPYSDIVALMVLEHQAHLTNLITRIGWEARRVEHRAEMVAPADRGRSTDDGRFLEIVDEAAVELVDYLLFVDEAPLPPGVAGGSGFSELFSARGPRDGRGRSLREISLDGRLFRYPCSYMIYTEAFDALPETALDAVYQRMWAVLSGEVTESPYDRLALADRQAIVEILRDTKPGLPDYFGTVTR